MKKYYLFAGLVLLAASPSFAQTKIGASGAPDPSAMLEVTSGASSNKGLLLPKMTTTQRNAIVSPANGLMVYNTTTNEVQVNTGTPALPTWTVATATATGWTTVGNTGTTPATNFIGTTDNQPLTIRTNNTEKVRVTTAGNVGIGTNVPGSRLHIFDTADVAVRVSASSGKRMGIELGNASHGVARNLSNSGGLANDVALYTSSGADSLTEGTLYLAANPIANDSIPLTQFALKKNGNIGIGTNTPTAKLHVNNGNITITNNGPTSASAINVISDNAGGLNPDNVSITAYGVSNPIYGISVARGSLDVPQNSQAGDNTGSLYFAPRINAGFAAITGITSRYLGNGTTSKSALHFLTSSTIAMTIDSSGYVGIGTNTPIAKLNVVDTGNAYIVVGSSTNGMSSVSLINGHHGMSRNLTSSGGTATDVALYTTSGPGSPASLYLAAKPAISDSIPLDQFVLKNNGNVGIGTGAPTAKLSVNGTTNNLSGTWGIFSDARVKTVDGEYEDGLATVMKIHPVKFHYNANAPFKSAEQQIGIIAQEMEQIAPYMVSKIKSENFADLRQYNNQALPYMLVNAIQEQQAQIETLKEKNEQLEAANKVTAQLMERVKQMEQMMGINEIEGTSKVAGK